MKIGSAIALPEDNSSRSGVRKISSHGISIFHAPDKHEQKNEKFDSPVISREGPRYHTDYYSRHSHEKQFPVSHEKRGSPAGQRAIDFYNITAAIGNYKGEGELIGVDTYA